MTRPVTTQFNERVARNRDQLRIRNLERRMPAGGSTSWCLLFKDADPPDGAADIDASGGTNDLDLTAGPFAPDASFFTNNSDIFEAAAIADPPRGTFGGLKILQPGVYRVQLEAAWSTIETAALGEVYRGVTAEGAGVAGARLLGGRLFVKGDDAWAPFASDPNMPTVFWWEALNCPADAVPVDIVFWALQQDATTDGVLDHVTVFLEQISGVESGF